MTAEQGHRGTILIVDDDADLQDVLRVALEADGYAVAVANNGRDAIDYLRSHDATCVILLDLLLPEMDGAQFRQIQRRDRALAWIPVIVMSGAMDADRSVRELGTDLLVAKPVNLDYLREAVGRVAGRNCVYARTAVELAGRGGRSLSSA
jgi:CheY-like chemotaxis protein